MSDVLLDWKFKGFCECCETGKNQNPNDYNCQNCEWVECEGLPSNFMSGPEPEFEHDFTEYECYLEEPW